MRRSLRRPAAGAAAWLAACLVVGICGEVRAQSQAFGRNKVQYRDFRFEVLQTEHFDVYFYAEEAEAARQVARMAERWYARLSGLLAHTLEGRQPLVLYATHAHFAQTNVVSGAIGEGTGGVTEGFKRRIVLPLAPTLGEIDHVLGHELVHAFQYDMARRQDDAPGLLLMSQLPLWFVEGMAEYLSIGPEDVQTAMWMRDAAGTEDELPDLDDLDAPERFPYRWGHAFWAYVAGRWGDVAVGRVFAAALASGRAIGAIEETLGESQEDLSRAWHDALRAFDGPVREATRPARQG